MPADPTCSPALRSFLPIPPDSDFPLQNLPYGVFRRVPGGGARVGVAISDQVLDLAVLEEVGLFDAPVLAGKGFFSRPRLNEFMGAGEEAWREARARISRLLSHDEPRLQQDEGLRQAALLPLRRVEMQLPAEIGDYTDFYSSRDHATNVGTMFRGKENALNPNWLHLPVGYHGRASSVVLGGGGVFRPSGQTFPDGAPGPVFGPSRQLDFELEVGFFCGPGNRLGEPIPVSEAQRHIFGFVLVNDWSARDIQKWEYVPLGPFLSKNFLTSISPWVVTAAALAPFRVDLPAQDPEPLGYLRMDPPSGLDIELEVSLQSSAMGAPAVIARSNARHLYWSPAQQVAHHTITGCNLRPGDLLASGTISGPAPESRGSLLELAWRGAEPLALPGGESRVFLEDGDHLTIRGWCAGEGYRIGFGEVSGTVLPARGGSR